MMRWSIDNQLINSIVIRLITMYIIGTFIMKMMVMHLYRLIIYIYEIILKNFILYFLLFQLLLYLKDFSQKMISRVHEIEKEVDGLMHDSKVIKCCYRDKKRCYIRLKFNTYIEVLSCTYLTLHSWTYRYIILFQLLYFSDDWCKGKQCLQWFHHAGQYSVCRKCKYLVVIRKNINMKR